MNMKKDRKLRKLLGRKQELQIKIRGEEAERDCLKGIIDRAKGSVDGAFMEKLMHKEGFVARLTGELELLNKEIEKLESG